MGQLSNSGLRWVTSDGISLPGTHSPLASIMRQWGKGWFIEREENSPSLILCNNSPSGFVLQVPLVGRGRCLVQTEALGTFSPNIEETLTKCLLGWGKLWPIFCWLFLWLQGSHLALMTFGSTFAAPRFPFGLAFYGKSSECFLSHAAAWTLHQSAWPPFKSTLCFLRLLCFLFSTTLGVRSV